MLRSLKSLILNLAMTNESIPAALKSILEGSGISFKQNPISYIFDCPRCSKKQKLYIRKRDGRFVCWSCRETAGYKGRAEFALSDLLQRSVSDIRAELYGDIEIQANTYLECSFTGWGETEEEEDTEASWPRMPFPFDYYPVAHTWAKKGRDYLEGRAIPCNIAEEYDIRYCPAKRAVMFPVVVRGIQVGWQERVTYNTRLWDEEKGWTDFGKAKTAPGTPRDAVVMFADRLEGSNHCIITEGPVDAIKTHLCGGGVATMGKTVTPSQIELIRSYGVNTIYVGLDPSAA